MTKQDCIGAPKISALIVPSASGTVKNMFTPMHCAAAQHTKPTTTADASGKNTSKRSIHRVLAKFFTCLPSCTPVPSPVVPTTGQIVVACYSMPLNDLRPLATTTPTLTHGQSASMAVNSLSSPKAFPISTPLNVAPSKLCTTPTTKAGRFQKLWKASNSTPSSWSRPLPSSVAV